jgi:hypothetical protein
MTHDPQALIPKGEGNSAPAGLCGSSLIVLPSGNISISESAHQIFQLVAPTRTLFWRGGAIVEMVEQDGVARLEVLKPEAFRSRVERHGLLFALRSDGQGEQVLKRTKMPRDDAAALMATAEARDLLPPVASVLRCPVLVESSNGEVAILARGYHRELGGLLIVAGAEPPRVELPEAVASLKRVIEQFEFQGEGDRSRAIAAFITPALRAGGFLSGCAEHVPIDVAEADQSQSGKGYRHSLVCAIFNESSYFVTARNGGVGSTDESFAAALISGRPFVCLDNFRGRLDSQHLEAFLTCPTMFPARIPHRGEVMVNPKRFLLQMSSNGLEATRDLANRASICRIRKRLNFNYRDTLGDIQQRQPYFLGCVFAVIAEWVAKGKPRTNDSRHSFRAWSQTLDWIAQNIFKCAPLMDDHEAAQDRVSNPALSWLRTVALATEREGKLGAVLTAGELVEICQLHGLEIPGLHDADEDRAKRQLGILMRRVFQDGAQITVESYTVARGVCYQSRVGGGPVETKTYKFAKL